MRVFPLRSAFGISEFRQILTRAFKNSVVAIHRRLAKQIQVFVLQRQELRSCEAHWSSPITLSCMCNVHGSVNEHGNVAGRPRKGKAHQTKCVGGRPVRPRHMTSCRGVRRAIRSSSPQLLLRGGVSRMAVQIRWTHEPGLLETASALARPALHPGGQTSRREVHSHRSWPASAARSDASSFQQHCGTSIPT